MRKMKNKDEPPTPWLLYRQVEYERRVQHMYARHLLKQSEWKWDLITANKMKFSCFQGSLWLRFMTIIFD